MGGGLATVRYDDDALARQRQIIAWHPLRAYNAINVRALGADLLVVHIQLQLDPAKGAQRPEPVAERLTAASPS